MEYLNKATGSLLLKIVSTVSGGLFVGGALYIDCVESPARMTHDAASAITMWKPSFVRAKQLQSKLAIISGLTSFGVYGNLYGSDDAPIEWLFTGAAMLSILPYTLIWIRPLNVQLRETEKCISAKGDSWINENLRYWGHLHSVRTLVSLGAFTFMVYTLASKRG